jgi:hypothetical protein
MHNKMVVVLCQTSFQVEMDLLAEQPLIHLHQISLNYNLFKMGCSGSRQHWGKGQTLLVLHQPSLDLSLIHLDSLLSLSQKTRLVNLTKLSQLIHLGNHLNQPPRLHLDSHLSKPKLIHLDNQVSLPRPIHLDSHLNLHRLIHLDSLFRLIYQDK